MQIQYYCGPGAIARPYQYQVCDSSNQYWVRILTTLLKGPRWLLGNNKNSNAHFDVGDGYQTSFSDTLLRSIVER